MIGNDIFDNLLKQNDDNLINVLTEIKKASKDIEKSEYKFLGKGAYGVVYGNKNRAYKIIAFNDYYKKYDALKEIYSLITIAPEELGNINFLVSERYAIIEMNLIEGITIDIFIKEFMQKCNKKKYSGCTIEDFDKIVIKLSDLVKEMYLLGFVNMDIKPGNIIITKKNDEYIPVIIDYGVMIFHKLSLPYKYKPIFISAPEIIKIKSEDYEQYKSISYETSLYSIGLMFAFLCDVFNDTRDNFDYYFSNEKKITNGLLEEYKNTLIKNKKFLIFSKFTQQKILNYLSFNPNSRTI